MDGSGEGSLGPLGAAEPQPFTSRNPMGPQAPVSLVAGGCVPPSPQARTSGFSSLSSLRQEVKGPSSWSTPLACEEEPAVTLNSKVPRAGKTFHPVALFGLVALLSHLLGWVQTPGELGMEKGPSLCSLVLGGPPRLACVLGRVLQAGHWGLRGGRQAWKPLPPGSRRQPCPPSACVGREPLGSVWPGVRTARKRGHVRGTGGWARRASRRGWPGSPI